MTGTGNGNYDIRRKDSYCPISPIIISQTDRRHLSSSGTFQYGKHVLLSFRSNPNPLIKLHSLHHS